MKIFGKMSKIILDNEEYESRIILDFENFFWFLVIRNNFRHLFKYFHEKIYK